MKCYHEKDTFSVSEGAKNRFAFFRDASILHMKRLHKKPLIFPMSLFATDYHLSKIENTISLFLNSKLRMSRCTFSLPNYVNSIRMLHIIIYPFVIFLFFSFKYQPFSYCNYILEPFLIQILTACVCRQSYVRPYPHSQYKT